MLMLVTIRLSKAATSALVAQARPSFLCTILFYKNIKFIIILLLKPLDPFGTETNKNFTDLQIIYRVYRR